MKKFTSKGYGSRGKASGFSLIELLVVIGILALLAALGASTLGSSKARGVDNAGNTVSSLAQLARQHASSLNTLTALVVAETTDAGDLEKRAMVSVWDFDSSLKANQIERWTLLPSSVTVTTQKENVWTDGSFKEPPSITYKNASVNGAKCFWFYADGRMGDGNSIPTLKLTPNKGDQGNSYELVFNPVIGTHKINRP